MLALFIGAAVPAVASASFETMAAVFGGYGDDAHFHGWFGLASFFGIRSTVWLIAWLFGLTVFAILPWAVLHRLRFRRWTHAMSLGFLIIFWLVMVPALFERPDPPGSSSSASDGGQLTMVNGLLTPYGWMETVTTAVFGGAVAALVGLLIWCSAYKKQAQSPR